MPDRCGARTHPNHRGRVRTSSAETTAKLALWGFLVTNLVTRRQIVPINGVRREPDFLENSSDSLLGYLDSNQEQLNQNQPCCQLHHTPTAPTGVGPRGPAKPDRVATLPYGGRGAEPGVGVSIRRSAATRPAGWVLRGCSTSGVAGLATDPPRECRVAANRRAQGAAAPSGRASRPCRGSPSTRTAAG